MPNATPTQVLESIVTGINSGKLDDLLPLYEDAAAFATRSPATSLTARPASAEP